MTVLVVGAGISGVACAQRLRSAGVPVTVLERSDSPGGRMASAHVDGRITDLGASYLTVDDKRFRDALAPLCTDGILRPWTDTFATVQARTGVRGTSSGPVRYAAPRGLASVVSALAEGLDVRFGTGIDRLSRDASGLFAAAATPRREQTGADAELYDAVRYDAVVLAMPAPQALALLDAGFARTRAPLAMQRWEPALALVARYDEVPDWIGDGVFVNGDETLSFAAHDGRRRGDQAPVLVAHSTGGYAAQPVTHPDAAAAGAASALSRLLELPPPQAIRPHRWPYARPLEGSRGPYLLSEDGIGCCGDAYGTPKVETAWLSGHLLGAALADRLR